MCLFMMSAILPGMTRDMLFICYLPSACDAETAAFASLVSLTCCKRTVRLLKNASRKNWSPTVKNCMDSFMLRAKVSSVIYLSMTGFYQKHLDITVRYS